MVRGGDEGEDGGDGDGGGDGGDGGGGGGGGGGGDGYAGNGGNGGIVQLTAFFLFAALDTASRIMRMMMNMPTHPAITTDRVRARDDRPISKSSSSSSVGTELDRTSALAFAVPPEPCCSRFAAKMDHECFHLPEEVPAPGSSTETSTSPGRIAKPDLPRIELC